MSFLEKDYKDSTQLAYMECFSSAFKKLQDSGKDGPFSVRELLLASINVHDAELRAIEEGYPANTLSIKDLVKYSTLSSDDINRIRVLSNKCLNWKIKNIHDTNNENGFYGCLIETEPGKSIIAFRGSESTGNNIKNDWIEADFGLLGSVETIQHKEVEKYADELINSGVIDQYDEIGVTGHSLGGNLATHFGIISSEKGRENLLNKITNIVNMDGPRNV